MPEEGIPPAAALVQYLTTHTRQIFINSMCRCGNCLNLKGEDPTGHCVNLGPCSVVAINHPDADSLISLVSEYRHPKLTLNPFDGKIYDYIELGEWLSGQGNAYLFIGLSALLGITHVLPTPSGPVLIPRKLSGRLKLDRLQQ